MMEQTTINAQVPTLPNAGYVREAQLVTKKGRQGIIPFSPATLWRKVATGDFPQPVKLSAGVTAWRVEDVREWMRRH